MFYRLSRKIKHTKTTKEVAKIESIIDSLRERESNISRRIIDLENCKSTNNSLNVLLARLKMKLSEMESDEMLYQQMLNVKKLELPVLTDYGIYCFKSNYKHDDADDDVDRGFF